LTIRSRGSLVVNDRAGLVERPLKLIFRLPCRCNALQRCIAGTNVRGRFWLSDVVPHVAARETHQRPGFSLVSPKRLLQQYPFKAEIGGVTDAPAPEFIAQLRATFLDLR
jgi:hypothetical protein